MAALDQYDMINNYGQDNHNHNSNYENNENHENEKDKSELNGSTLPPGAVLYEICFKVCTHIFCYENNDLELPCLVIVQADRGYDIGVAIRCLPEGEMPTNGKPIRKILSVITNDDKYIKYMLQSKVQSEKHALVMSKSICSELKVGPSVDIISVEFQADRKKLTVYYKKHADVSLCKLIRKLHSAFKMRIWMENIDTMMLEDGQNISHTFQTLEERYYTFAAIDPRDSDPSDKNLENPTMNTPSESRSLGLAYQPTVETTLQSNQSSGLSFLPRSGSGSHSSVPSVSYPEAIHKSSDHNYSDFQYHDRKPHAPVRTELDTYQYNRSLPAPAPQHRRSQLPSRPPPPSGYSDYLPQPPPRYGENQPNARGLNQPYRQQPQRAISHYSREYGQHEVGYPKPRHIFGSGGMDSEYYQQNVYTPSRAHVSLNQSYYDRYQSPRNLDFVDSNSPTLTVHHPAYSSAEFSKYRPSSHHGVHNGSSTRSSFPSMPYDYDHSSNYRSFPVADLSSESNIYEPFHLEDPPASDFIQRQDDSRVLSRLSNVDEYRYRSEYLRPNIPIHDQNISLNDSNLNGFQME